MWITQSSCSEPQAATETVAKSLFLIKSKASLTVSSLPVSSQAITAVYSGDANYVPSTSAVLSQTVNQDATTTTVISSTNPSVYGQSVTFTATVSVNSPGSGTPTGMIMFYSGTTLLGTGMLSGETASFTTTSPLAAGNRTIKATYSGDTNDKTSSGTLTQTVNQDSTTTSVVSSLNPSAYGQSVTFTATVSASAPGSGTPAGSVTFMDGSTKLATVALKNGAALYSTAKLPTGTDTITATYNGSSSFKTSSASVSQTVNQDQTTTKLTSSVNPSVYGQAVTFTATVSAASPGSGTPSGSITFMDGGNTIGTGLLSSGKATFTTSSLSVGSHAITAVYSGDGNFTASTSTAISKGVNQAGSSTTVVSSVNPSVSGQLVTFMATVSATSPGSGTPTGTVTFEDGSTTLGTATLSGGTASLSISTLAVGTHSIKVIYSGDANFKTSTSVILKQVVNQQAAAPLVASAITVDAALASLQDETSDGVIESLAMEQVSSSTNGQQRRAY